MTAAGPSAREQLIEDTCLEAQADLAEMKADLRELADTEERLDSYSGRTPPISEAHAARCKEMRALFQKHADELRARIGIRGTR